ncbi:MAG: pitrilysin family protein, partial [Gemmatimonadaceae bacterium]
LVRDGDAMRSLLGSAHPDPLPVSPPRVATAGPTRAPVVRLEREEARVRVYRTGQGIPILVRRKGGAPLIHLGVYALGGASDEAPARAGMTSLMVRTAIKGTERRTAAQIAEDSELLGGSVGGAAGAENFGWAISVPSVYADAALELLADVIQHPTFPDDALQTERAVAIADLELLRDDMYRFPVRLMTQTAFAGHSYGVPASGTEASLAAVNADDLRQWHRTRMLAAPAVIAVVGDVEPDEIAAAVAKCFPLLHPATPHELDAPRWPAEARLAVEQREKAQTALALGFPAPARGDDDRFAAHLIAGVASGLGGRFFDELRDRQSLAYTVSAYSSERRLAGMFVAYIATSPEKEDVARDGLLAEFAKLREQLVTDEELTRAKEYAIGTYAIHQASGGAVLGDLVDAWLFGRNLRELEEHDARVRAVAPLAMRDLARRYFDDGRVVQGIVRGVGKAV